MRCKFAGIAALALAFLVVGAPPAHAQFGKLKSKIKQKVEQKVDQHTDEAAQAAVDQADASAQCAAGVADCGSADAAPAAGGASSSAGSGSRAEVASPAASAELPDPGKGAYVNYDFKPGDTPIFVDDFSHDEVGNFPRRLELVRGNFEVAEWQGSRYLRGTSFGGFYVPLPDTLPEQFTLEFDFTGASGWNTDVYFNGLPGEGPVNFVEVSPTDGGVSGGKVQSTSNVSHDLGKQPFPVRIMVDGHYVKVYLDDKRVANIPNADLGRGNRIYFAVSASEREPALIGNIRVMAGGKKLYDALASTGRVATQGIYFDTGSDRLRPESSGTLREIAEMLKAHPDLKLTIEGHTDNVGNAASNQALSERRAASVRAALVSTYGVDGGRLIARGYGASKPVASNDTPEGRQQNRRVELVRM